MTESNVPSLAGPQLSADAARRAPRFQHGRPRVTEAEPVGVTATPGPDIDDGAAPAGWKRFDTTGMHEPATDDGISGAVPGLSPSGSKGCSGPLVDNISGAVPGRAQDKSAGECLAELPSVAGAESEARCMRSYASRRTVAASDCGL